MENRNLKHPNFYSAPYTAQYLGPDQRKQPHHPSRGLLWGLILCLVVVLFGGGYFAYSQGYISVPFLPTLKNATTNVPSNDNANVVVNAANSNISNNQNTSELKNTSLGITPGVSDPAALLAAATTPFPPVDATVYQVNLHAPILTTDDITPRGIDPLTPAGRFGFGIEGPSGTINPGEKIEKTFIVSEATSTTILLEGKPKYTFTLPDGMKLEQQKQQSNPKVTYEEAAELGLSVFSIEYLPAGHWGVTIDGANLSESEQYSISLILSGGPDIIHLEAMSATSDPAYSFLSAPGDIVYIRTYISHNGQPVPGVQWKVVIKNPNLTVHYLDIFDDGRHADGQANDGIFVGALKATGPDGHNEIYARATLPGGIVTSTGGNFEVAAPDDLLIDGFTHHTPENIVSGQLTTLTPTIKNAGTVDHADIEVDLFINDTKVDTQKVTLKAGQSQQISLRWKPTEPGSHKIRITINPFLEHYSSDFKNNSQTFSLTVQ